MKNNNVLVALILGISMILSSYLISSGMKSISKGIISAGNSMEQKIYNRNFKVQLDLSGGNIPIKVQNIE